MATNNNEEMTQPKTVHTCPFESAIAKQDGGVEHVEGRFSALETKVNGLQSGMEAMERSVAEGFKEVRRLIEGMSQDRRVSTIPWLMVGFAVLGLVATVGFQMVNGVQNGVMKAENNLALANARELQYREDKGRAEERSAQLSAALHTFTETYTTQHKDLDDKLQRETSLTSKAVENSVAGLDSKIQAEFAGWRKAIDDKISALAEHNKILDSRWLERSEEAAYFRGKTDANAKSLEDQVDVIESRQYKNTGEISALRGNK